ncbi:hypothetical protein [Streptomyces sp. LN245]|uniref:hypothetical protein n=1 Tax=Streptomyces sp. LN245 TaxID=3112975 RepID=UPI00371EA541
MPRRSSATTTWCGWAPTARASRRRGRTRCARSSAIKRAVTSGFRSIHHCSYADQEAIDLLDEAKDSVFLSPAVGIMWANVHEGEEFGIDTATAQKMGSVKALDAMTKLYPELRRRGLRVLPGGDYDFPDNPIGRNARDLELFVELFGYSPLEALKAATFHGGQVLDLPVDGRPAGPRTQGDRRRQASLRGAAPGPAGRPRMAPVPAVPARRNAHRMRTLRDKAAGPAAAAAVTVVPAATGAVITAAAAEQCSRSRPGPGGTVGTRPSSERRRR